MPELPEVETVVTALAKALTGRAVTTLEQRGALRYPLGREAGKVLPGHVVTGVRRRAKYIVFAFDNCPHGLLAHLGMTGSFRIVPDLEPYEKHDRLAIGLDNGESLRFADMRRFGFVKLVRLDSGTGEPDEFARLGPEPLDRTFTGRELWRRCEGRTCPIKNHIMNQEVVVGVGNIYASEALFIAGISPERPAGELDRAEADALVAAIKKVLRAAIRSGGSTIRNYRTVDGREGGFQRVIRVYGRAGERCRRCGGTVASIRQGGRSTFYCPTCQR
ncbi:MAG: bifunctional DNA-formamidopyrimidine glycosylase/DNA-(apurinic or apyrimidinic site) lyase [Planctomycetes bacterium]|nr:bifunctional DNA-formamidopyrimidine glycosylase/DNA-(apurinic or apyrimidinic site) lyase [Planctomycetota bacterium]